MTRLSQVVGAQVNRRLGLTATSGAPDDRLALDTIERSRSGEWLLGLVGWGQRGLESSAVAMWARRQGLRWTHMAPASRQREQGVVLLVAGATSLVLTGSLGRPAGWLWMVIPAVAAAVGALLVAVSTAHVSRTQVD